MCLQFFCIIYKIILVATTADKLFSKNGKIFYFFYSVGYYVKIIHEDILYISYHKYIKTSLLIINMHYCELHLNNFKDDFFNI